MSNRNRARIRAHAVLAAIATGLVAFGVCCNAEADNAASDESAHSAASVIAVDDHWLVAEENGDVAWLGAMLLPDYRSISADGRVLDRKTLLAHAEKNRGSDQMRKKVDAWLKTHPSEKSVVMRGDIAILSFTDPHTGRVRSSDIFMYEAGGWHGLYSQHSKTE